MKLFALNCSLMVALLLGVAGCATRPQVDWNARIGTFTFDQAVIELGPPAKQATLKDGTIVAEWQTARGYTQTYYTPYYGYGYHRHGYYAPVYHVPVTTSWPDAYLRLVFDPAGKLTSWKRVYL